MYLEKINGPEDVKKIEIDKLPVLAQEIRDALLVPKIYWERYQLKQLNQFFLLSIFLL